MTAPVRPSDWMQTLRSMFGGNAAVVQSAGPSGDPYGEYATPTMASKGDTVYMSPRRGDGNSAPFVLAHELGHRLFAQADPELPAEYRPDMHAEPSLSPLAAAIRARAGDTAPTEEFARALSEALQGFAPPSSVFSGPLTHRANPSDVAALRQWIRGRPEMNGVYERNAMQSPDATAVRR